MFERAKANSLFIYFIVVITSIMYFRTLNIGLNTLLGLIVASIIIYIYYQNEVSDQTDKEALHQLKADNIYPSPKLISKYVDLTDFIFSIQDFYEYNPQAYENMIHALDTFLEIYEEVQIDSSLAGRHYDNADSQKSLILNNLHSIIISIPSSKLLIKKLDNSLQTLEELINNYLTVIYEANQNYIKTHGYFNNTKIINLNVKPFDSSFDETDGKYY